MAIARIVHRWPDGVETKLEVHVAASFPDALDEARVTVTKMWRETCCEPEPEP
jgi:hypothetical protein